MRKTIQATLVAGIFAAALAAQEALPELAGDEIMRRVDANLAAGSIAYSGVMEIDLGHRTLRKEMRVVAQGQDRSFVEFVNPEDEGVRYLKIGDELWMYFPEEGDTVKISGHLLKEGMMGSDLSYEDTLESGALTDQYDITVSGTEELDGRPCYVLELSAKVRDVSYERQKFWVDGQRFVVLKSEMYAKSGKLLKESRVLEVKAFGKRWYPVTVMMKDLLKKGGGTVFTMTDVRFDVSLPDDMFSLRRLGR